MSSTAAMTYNSTHFLRGLPSIPSGDHAFLWPFANADTAPSCARLISSVTHEKLKGHLGSRDRKDESTLKAASRSRAVRITFSHESTLGLISERIRGCRAKNLEKVWFTIEELNNVMNPISAVRNRKHGSNSRFLNDSKQTFDREYHCAPRNIDQGLLEILCILHWIQRIFVRLHSL